MSDAYQKIFAPALAEKIKVTHAVNAIKSGNNVLPTGEPLTPEIVHKANVHELIKAGGPMKIPASIKPGENSLIEKWRAAAIAGDFDTLFSDLPASSWPGGISMGKFRFNWNADGSKSYVPWARENIETFFRSPHLRVHSDWQGNCPEDFLKKYIHDYSIESDKRKSRSPSDPQRVYPLVPAGLLCDRKKGSPWKRIQKPLTAWAAAVAVIAVSYAYLGKSAAASAEKVAVAKTGTGAAETTAFTKFKTTANKVLNYVNKGRSIEAIAKGELPPPPINVAGSSFTDWAMIVAKDEIKKAAMSEAAELGVEYVQKKLTAKEEAALRAEIEAMQRELIAIEGKKAPQPPTELSRDIVAMQDSEIVKAATVDKLIKYAAIIGIPLLVLRS